MNHPRPEGACDEAPEYVREVAERCADAVDGYLGETYDAYNTRFAGPLGAILLLTGSVAAERADRWLNVVSRAIVAVEDDGDREDLTLFLNSVAIACELVRGPSG